MTTLATDIITLLDRTTQTLSLLLSSPQAPAEQHTLMLRQLVATCEAAARVAETERMKAEAMLMRSEKLTLDAETARLSAVTQRVTVAAEMERVKVVTEARAAERVKVEAETERMEVEMEARAEQALTAVAEAEKLTAEATVARSEAVRIDAETERLKPDAVGLQTKVNAEPVAVAEKGRRTVGRAVAGARDLSPGAMTRRRERINSAITERLNAEAEVLIAEIETARYKAGMRVLPVETEREASEWECMVVETESMDAEPGRPSSGYLE